MPFPPTQKTMEGLLKDNLERLTLVERRLAIGGGGSSPYDAQPGMVMPFAGPDVPDGWLLCDGSAVSRNTYSKLFAVIGTTYGPGDGSTTFPLPNYKGRVLVGLDAAQAEFDVLGETGGAKAVALTANQLAMHGHTYPMDDMASGAGYVSRGAWAYDATSTPSGGGGHFATSGMFAGSNNTSANVAGGEAHNNLQPYAVAQYIISTGEGVGGGTFAATGGGGTTIVQSGLVLLRPTSVVGGTVDGNVVKFNGASAVSFNNLWDSSLYDDYMIEVRITSTTSGGWLRMRKNGVDTAGNVYGNQQTFNNTGSGLTTAYAATSGWIFAATPGVQEKFSFKLSRPSTPGPEYVFIDLEQTVQLSDGLLSGWNRGTTNAQTYDGFSMVSAGGTITGTITVYGMSKTAGQAVAAPTNQWQDFRLAATAGTVAAPGNQVVWDGVVSGNLGATLSADKKTITLPSAGTYRVLPHIGVSAGNGAAANANADVNGVSYTPSFGYGAGGPAGAWSYDTEFYITVTGPTTIRYAVNPASIYFWSWLRIEKQESVNYGTALAIQQGSTTERDAVYGIPATDQAKASLANRKIQWFNTDKGWMEGYYATTGTPGLTALGLVAGTTSGWYPTGPGPECFAEPSAAYSAAAGNYLQNWNGAMVRRGGPTAFELSTGGIAIFIPGYYELSILTNQTVGSGVAEYALRLLNAGTPALSINFSGSPLSPNVWTPAMFRTERAVAAGLQLTVFCVTGSLAVHQGSGVQRGQLAARYLRPLLVSD